VLLQAIHQHQGTLCWLPNFAYNFLATRVRPSALNGLDLSSLRAVINCSEPVRHDSHLTFTSKFANFGLSPVALQTCYAMAENTFAVTQSAIDQAPRVDFVDRKTIMEQRIAQPIGDSGSAMAMVSCGRPIAHTENSYRGRRTARPAERHVGEIALRSDCMLTGYYHREEATAKRSKRAGTSPAIWAIWPAASCTSPDARRI